MAKRKTKKAPRKSKSQIDQLFETHKNLKWLLPLFVLVVILYFLLYS